MTARTDHHGLDPIIFERIRLEPTAVWHPLISFAFVQGMSQIPISDSELLQSSHHLPIAIDCMDDRLQVVAIVAGQYQRAPLLDSNGHWQRGYMPIALRCLPFRSAGDTVEVATNVEVHQGPPLPIVAEDGSPTAEVQQIIRMLRKLDTGQQRLQRAAERLFIADVLTPFQMMKMPGSATALSRFLTVDRNKFSMMSNRRIAQISRDDFLPIDVAAACLFSQRLLPAAISVAADTRELNDAGRPNGQPDIGFKSHAQLDPSELFSFEAFSGADN